jgi:hypothetical protein
MVDELIKTHVDYCAEWVMFNEMSIALAPPSNSCSLASCRNILLAVVSCLIFSPEIPSVHSPSPPRWWSICSCKLKKQRGKRSEIVWVGSPQALSLVSTVSCPDQHAVPTTTMEREDRRYKGSHGSQTDNKLPRLKCIYSSCSADCDWSTYHKLMMQVPAVSVCFLLSSA